MDLRTGSQLRATLHLPHCILWLPENDKIKPVTTTIIHMDRHCGMCVKIFSHLIPVTALGWTNFYPHFTDENIKTWVRSAHVLIGMQTASVTDSESYIWVSDSRLMSGFTGALMTWDFKQRRHFWLCLLRRIWMHCRLINHHLRWELDAPCCCSSAL